MGATPLACPDRVCVWVMGRGVKSVGEPALRLYIHIPMEFEWDPAKREQNLEKHGVDFLVATQVFRETHITVRTNHPSEPRWMAIGPLPYAHVPNGWTGPLCAVVYTKRDNTYRIVSARRARTNERDDYRTKITGGDSP